MCFFENLHFLFDSLDLPLPLHVYSLCSRWAWCVCSLGLRAATAARGGDAVVLDVGSGAGLLSLVAASLGARKVYALEANRELADVSRALVRRNKAAGVVEVRHAMSTECAKRRVRRRRHPNTVIPLNFLPPHTLQKCNFTRPPSSHTENTLSLQFSPPPPPPRLDSSSVHAMMCACVRVSCCPTPLPTVTEPTRTHTVETVLFNKGKERQ